MDAEEACRLYGDSLINSGLFFIFQHEAVVTHMHDLRNIPPLPGNKPRQALRAYLGYGEEFPPLAQPGKLLIGDRAAYYLRYGDHGVELDDWMALLKFYKN